MENEKKEKVVMMEQRQRQRQRQQQQHCNTNGVPMVDGGKVVMHVGVGRGDVAPRIVTVGHPDRASMLAKEFLENITVTRSSSRGFVTYTGTFGGILPISIISIGMGGPMMDFMVREVRSVVDGPMAIIRLGTCGTFQKNINVGTIAVASEGSILVTRNYDYFLHTNNNNNNNHESIPPYHFSQVCPSDEELTKLLISELEDFGCYSTGLNVTGESFYSTQGRIDDNFDDDNQHIIETIIGTYSNAISCEMETFHLLHLAHCSKKAKIHATSMAIALANRITGDVATKEALTQAERSAGIAALKALLQIKL